MKVLAIEKEVEGVQDVDYLPFLEAEAREVWKLKMEDILREAYFTDNHEAVLILECRNKEEAGELLSRLPLVQQNLISFSLYELHPYNGFERLFH
ncbi:MAG: hypothetical protein U0T82_12380 [Bacteroidales bacterium]